jgi:thymidylate synthase
MLMKDPQYHLFGILKLRKLKKYIQEKNIENVRCYRCAGELKDKYDYVWVNEFNVLCTDCHQDSKQIEQLIKELNHNPFHLPHYEGDDWARIDSILDKVGGSL